MEQEREPEIDVEAEPPTEEDTSELQDPLTDLLLGIDAKLDYQNALLKASLDDTEIEADASTTEETGQTADVPGPETRTGPGAESSDTRIEPGNKDSSTEQEQEREPDHEPDSGNWYYRKRFGGQ